MSRLPSIAITSGLIGCGVLAWALAGRPLTANKNLAVPLNPMGINGSPYGQVFAMALQGPIETNFHIGTFGATCNCDDPEHEHNKRSKNLFYRTGSMILRPPEEEPPENLSLTERLKKTISVMKKANKQRTNPRPASEAQKFYLRRQAEDKLRFAYHLDPSHYANYAALHFFLVEGITTRPELVPTAAKLAEDTIRYCLKQKSDPRPSLTAAAACTNMLHLMFKDQKSDHPKFDTSSMRQYLEILDYCIANYFTIAKEWDQNGGWERLSPIRIDECDNRISFICKIRDAAEKTIIRMENEASSSAASSTVGNSPAVPGNS